MQKKKVIFFSFPSASNFGKARVTKSREQNKKKSIFSPNSLHRISAGQLEHLRIYAGGFLDAGDLVDDGGSVAFLLHLLDDQTLPNVVLHHFLLLFAKIYKKAESTKLSASFVMQLGKTYFLTFLPLYI